MAGPVPVTVNITASASAPSRKNFGVPLIMAYHTHNTDKVRIYTSLLDMVSDGFTTSEPAYLMASAVCDQNPRPPQFLVGRMTTAVAQTFTYTVTAHADGIPVGLSLLDPTGTLRDLYHTPSSETINQVATALAIVIAAAPGVASATATGADIVVDITAAGDVWYPSLLPNDDTAFAGGFQGGTFQDHTTTASLAADLTAIALVNPNFYGVAIQNIDPTNIEAAAGWVQSNGCLGGFVTADNDNFTVGSGVIHAMKALSYTRSIGLYSGSPGQFSALGLMAQRFTAVPGSDTWAFKTIIGVVPDDNLTPTQLANLQSNNGNYYTTIAGLEVVTDGRSAQGQYMDIQRGIDALANDMQVRVFGLMANSEKVPYTQAGITQVGTQMRASLSSFTATPSSPNLFLSSDPGFAPVVTLPQVGDISTADKQNRVLRNANFTATTTGAIQDVLINGTLSF